MITKEAYRDGMARLAAAVNVITTDGPAGAGGFTASAVCSVTDDPPTLLVCVNTLAASQSSVAERFAARDMAIDQRFAAAAWSRLVTGAPVLEGALASFDCRIVERLERGTHAVILCEVQAVKISQDAEALVYFGRGYRTLGQLD